MSLEGNFICGHCGKDVTLANGIGTMHRNHCPYCLWSKHLDDKKPGDRQSNCRGIMEPVALTFKNSDKELMLVHACTKCGGVAKNRLAGDDAEKMILEVLDKSRTISDDIRAQLKFANIVVAIETDRAEIKTQLFGKK